MTTHSPKLRLARYHRHTTQEDILNFRNGEPRGLVILDLNKETGECRWGWSLCHRDDRFNRKEAWALADDTLEHGYKKSFDKPSEMFISNITNPESMTAVLNSFPSSLRRTAVQVATTALRRYYLKGIQYDYRR